MKICIERSDRMGDMILTLPVIKGIKDQNPNTIIHVITSQKKLERITVFFNDLNDWISIKRSIGDISIVDKFNVRKFSHNKAIIFLSFSGNLNQLKVAFKQSDLDFDLNSKKLILIK